MSKKLAFIRLVCALAVPCTVDGLAAQTPATQGERGGSIVGVVTDAVTGAPVGAASVRLLEIGRSELSHQDGGFHFDRVAPGVYRVSVQRVGYAPREERVQISAGATSSVRVALAPTVVSIPGLVVTGTGRARSAGEAYRPTTVLDDAELRRGLSSTVAATLANEPGISQRYNGPAAAQPVIRGLGGDRVLVLEDGQRTGDIAATSADHAVTIEPLTAERIEVLRGPAGLLYGSNALGGVINVVRDEVPRTLPEALTGVLSAQAASVNRGITGGGSILGALGSVALRGELSARHGGDTRTPLGALPSTAFGTLNLGAGASWIGEGGFGGGAVRHYTMRYGVPGSFNGVTIPGAHEEGVTIEVQRSTLRGEGGLFTEIGPFTGLEWDAQYVRFEQNEIEEGGSVGTSFGQLTATTNVMAHHRHAAGELRSEGTVGAWGLWQDHRVSGSAGSAPARQLSGAAFAFEELSIDPFRLQVGGRMDWTRVTPLEPRSLLLGELRERDFAAFSGSIASLIEPRAGLIFGASLSRAFRTPSIPELYSGGPHLADYSFNVGNPDLEPEFGLGVDLFARMRLARASGELALFRNWIRNYIYYAPTGRLDPRLQRFPLYQARGDDARLEGAEGQIEWEVARRLVVEATGSYVRGSRQGGDEPLPAIPPLHGLVGLRYDAPGYFLSLGWEGAAAQRQVAAFETPTAGYQLVNAGAGLRWSGWGNLHTVTLQLRNLGDELWYEHLSRIRQVAPQPGRNAELLYRISF